MESKFQIKLANKSVNAFALISPKRAPYVLNYKWYLGKNGYPFSYQNGARIQLHRYIWYLIYGNLPDKTLYIDHINRNKLDASDENLRISTPAENAYNKTPKGKIIDPITNKPLHHIKLAKNGYVVSISKNGQKNKINNISSLEEAKAIYNLMATEMFGEFAVLY